MRHRDARSRRGFRRDEAATLAARFEDYRSFVSQPKAIKGECDEPKAHLVLYGADKAPIRAEIFRRNREAKSGLNRCVKCGQIVYERVREGSRWRFGGQWHHIRHRDGERCDCPENGAVSCWACHKPEHPQPKWTGDLRQEAAKV